VTDEPKHATIVEAPARPVNLGVRSSRAREPKPMSCSRTLLIAALMSITPLTLSCKHTPSEAHAPDHSHGHSHVHGHDPGAHGEVNEHGYRGHHRFDDPSKWAAEFDSPERAAWQKPDEVIASLELAEDAIVADLGAGTGYFAIRLAKTASKGKVYAVDIEPSMIAWLSERASTEQLANLVAVQGGADDPNLLESIDLAFMCNVFHHLGDPKAYFVRVGERLRPGARVVIVDFKPDNPEDAPGPPLAMRTSIEQVSAAMTEAGFRLAKTDTELLPWQYVLVFERQ
jgi:ubiquinone/menaquinone biosynthesis C-methylase UbiE